MNKMNKKGKIIGLSLIAIMVVSLFTTAITAQALPDLVITSFSTGADGKIQYTIANIGNADAPRSFTGVYSSGRYVARGIAKPLAAGASNVETINYRGGDEVCADYQNRIAESNEDNNCNPPGPGPTPPPPPPPPPPGALPDLVVSAKWETIEYNGQIVVHFTVKNIGNADAGESTACKYINGIQVGSVIVPALGDGTNFTAEFDPEDCPPGTTFDVTVCADNYDDVAESDETNNCMTNVFTCPPGPPPGGPDLVVDKEVEVVECANPKLQCCYDVVARVTNIGNEVADWSTTCIYIDGEHIAVRDQWTGRLGPRGKSAVLDFGRFVCPCGGDPVNVTVCADNYNVVEESNEANNNDTNIVDNRLGDIEVTKEVWDGADWVEEIDAEQGDDVLFRCIVHNSGCCCDLDDITVTDVLSDSLEYLGAFPVPDEVTFVVDGATTLKWVEADPLEPCEVLVYFIDARVIGCGVDTNTQSAVATDCTGEGVSDDDTATVNAPPEATLEVTKQVRLAGDLLWEDAIDVPFDALNPIDVEFRCTVHNDGTCCDLNQIEVWDVLRDQNLVVTRAVGPAGNPRPPIVDIRPDRTIVYWYIPDTIEYCDELVFRIDATLLAGTPAGDYTNTQRARAWSPRMEEYAGGWDVARVTIV